MIKRLALIAIVAAAAMMVPYIIVRNLDNRSNPQKRASHTIELIAVDESGGEHPDGLCTATAIGPHVLLTAEHCYDKEFDKEITIDMSTHKYHILDSTDDDRDHVMIAVDGPEFHNYIDLTMNFREPYKNEAVFMYGSGGGIHIPRLLVGHAVTGFDSDSEVDTEAAVQKFTMPAIPGDSGAAIYGKDGMIVALVTYKYGDECVGFSLNFSPEQIEVASNAGKGITID